MSEAFTEDEAVAWYYNALLTAVRSHARPSPNYVRNLHERLRARFGDEALIRITNAAYVRLAATIIKHNE